MKGDDYMLAKIIIYLAIGQLCIFSQGLIHLIVCERNGYKALEWWNDKGISLAKQIETKTIASNYLFESILWPYAIINRTKYYKICAELYDRYDD